MTKSPPGATGVAAVRHLMALSNDPLGMVRDRRAVWGDTWRLDPPGGQRLGGPMLVTCAADGMRDVLTAEGAVKDSPVYREMAIGLGDGLLTSEGDIWKRQRRIVQPLFTRRRVDGYAQTFGDVAEELVASIDAGTIDLDEAMQRMSLQAVSRTLFGTDLTDRVGAIVHHTAHVSDATLKRGLSPFPMPRWLPLPEHRRLAASKEALGREVDALVDGRRGKNGDDLVSLLLNATDPETGEPLGAVEVREQALVFLLAGHDTTSTTMTFALHELGLHPVVQAQVRAEVRGVDDLVAAALQGNLPRTRQVIDEALRLHSPAYITSRRTLQPTTIDGFDVEAGVTVATSFHAVHRNPSLWEDPDRFNPDRFLPAAVKTRERWAYVPFGGGPRTCIGNHFALLEATIGVATVIRDIVLDSDRTDIRVACGVTMRADEPVLARARPASVV